MSTEDKMEQLSKVQAQIDTLIAADRFYEALRLIVTLANRHLASNNLEQVFDITCNGAKMLFEKKQYVLGAEIAQHYLSLIEKGDIPACDVVKSLKGLFEAYNDPTPASTTNPKYIFMRDAIKLVQKQNKSKDHEVSPEEAILCHAMATWLFKAGERSLANAYYLKSDAHTEHAMKLVQWAKTVDPQEVDLFLLRAVLQYLCVNKVASAKHVYVLFDKLYSKNESFSSSPAVHLAFMLVSACKTKSVDLFRILEEKYAMTFLRDPPLKQYMTKIGVIHFDVKPPKGLLASLFQGE